MTDRPSLDYDGMDPTGHVCSACGARPATMAWGDALSINHGIGEWRCDVCALTAQLEFARERAAAIPELERQLADARGVARLKPDR